MEARVICVKIKCARLINFSIKQTSYEHTVGYLSSYIFIFIIVI